MLKIQNLQIRCKLFKKNITVPEQGQSNYKELRPIRNLVRSKYKNAKRAFTINQQKSAKALYHHVALPNRVKTFT